LHKFIEKGKVKPVDEDVARSHFEILTATLLKEGFVHYEFSNFGKPGYFSQNNTAYWMGRPYLGIGPSAHSYDGKNRKWNVSNNSLYIKSIFKGELPLKEEELTDNDKYNEYIMTRLRTMWGVSSVEVIERFGKKYFDYMMEQVQPLLKDGLIEEREGNLHVTPKGKFLSDGIAADLFLVDE